ncbi:MAG: hypothetical protein NSGCLCUN01_03723 [uncultured Clostridium sp.]
MKRSKEPTAPFLFLYLQRNDKILKFNMLMLSVETKTKGDEICGYKSCKGRSYKG